MLTLNIIDLIKLK